MDATIEDKLRKWVEDFTKPGEDWASKHKNLVYLRFPGTIIQCCVFGDEGKLRAIEAEWSDKTTRANDLDIKNVRQRVLQAQLVGEYALAEQRSGKLTRALDENCCFVRVMTLEVPIKRKCIKNEECKVKP